MIEKYMGAAPAELAGRGKKAATKGIEIGEDDPRFVDFGALPGDVLTLTPLEGEPERGETVVTHWIDGKDWQLAVFCNYAEDTESGWGRCPRLEEYDGQRFLYKPAGYDFYRIVSIRRATGAPKSDAKKIQERVKELRAKLESLDEDDFPREGERFKLEREIYGLERKARAEESASADEWPDTLEERGGAR